MKTLPQHIKKQMRDAPRHELDEEQAFHLLNCPDWQIGYMEKEIGQMFCH